MMTSRIIYAANRFIGLKCLEKLIISRIEIVALLLPSKKKATYDNEMISLIKDIPVIRGIIFRKEEGLKIIKNLMPDYIISVHFPYIFNPEIILIPKIGSLNLHPAYLPFNRGWNTPTWAILEGTPIGATLNWIDEGIDTGDIAIRRELKIKSEDTAHSLYLRLMELEVKIFEEAILFIKSNSLPRFPQKGKGTFHYKDDLKKILKLKLNKKEKRLLNKLRALTTDRIEESAFFEVLGKKYYIRVEITPEGEN